MNTHLSVSPDSAVPPSASDNFAEISPARLAALTSDALDELGFGVIGMAPDGTVNIYNAVEARLAGLSPGRVLGQHLFTAVAPCMNNFLVAQRFEDEAELDAIVPYVLTLRMRPTPVRLRLLRTSTQAERFLLIQR
jgi:photoactive yellow protein